jgi:hypothetical protein
VKGKPERRVTEAKEKHIFLDREFNTELGGQRSLMILTFSVW